MEEFNEERQNRKISMALKDGPFFKDLSKSPQLRFRDQTKHMKDNMNATTGSKGTVAAGSWFARR